MSTSKGKKKSPKVMALYQRYNENFGVPSTAEDLEEEQRYVRKRMAEITGTPQEPLDDQDGGQKRHRAQVEALLTRIQQQLTPPDMIPLFQYMVFNAIFATEEGVSPPDELHDTTELLTDKRLFFACQAGAAQAVRYVERLAEQLCERVSSRLEHADPALRAFHSAMRANPQVIAEHYHHSGGSTTAVNAWDNGQALRADVAYTHLTMVHTRENIYVTREQGRVLLLCYQVYHFVSLVKTMVASEYAREATTIQARSMTFCETWQHLSGSTLGAWKWMNHNNNSFVKTATQIMEALQTAQKWINKGAAVL